MQSSPLTPIDLKQLPDAELNASADRATAEIAELRAKLQTLDAEAVSAAADFDAEPNADTHAAQAISAKKLENAGKALAAKAAEHEPIFNEIRRRSQIRRRDELRALMDWRAHAGASSARILALYQTFAAGLAEESDKLSQYLAQVTQLAEEANNLERKVGDGRKHDRPKLSHALDMLILPELARTLGSRDALDQNRRATLQVGTTHAEAVIRVPVRTPEEAIR